MAVIDSNKFTITVNKQPTEIQIGTDGKTSEVVVYKGVNLLTPVSGTPSTNQYKVTLSSTGCVAGLKSDNKTIYIKSISSSNANITVSINVENIHTYIKNISVVKIIDEYEISNMKSAVSSIEQKADSITSKVNEVQYDLTNNYSTTVMMNSAIEQKADSITSAISKTYTTKDELNNLNIGSRNFLLETDDHKLCVGNGSENQSFPLYRISDPSALAGKTVTLSFQYRVTNWQGEGGFLPQTANNTWDNFEQYWLWSEGTFTYTSTINFSSSNKDTEIQIRCDWLKGTIEILPKTAVLVIGNKTTGWSPAPEDIDNKFANYPTTTQMESKINQTAQGINTEVSKKLNSADLSSRIQQSANDIKIGFNKITNFLTIDPNNGLQVNHTDGSYTRISAGGLSLYQASTGYRYKCLVTTGYFSIKGKGTSVITLPAQFDDVSEYDIDFFYTIETNWGAASSAVDKTCIYEMYANDIFQIGMTKDSNGHWTKKVDYSLIDVCVKAGGSMQVGDRGDMFGFVHWIAFA